MSSVTSSGSTAVSKEYHGFDWWKWIASNGLYAFMLCVFAGWFAQVIVVPMRQDQTRFMDSVIETNKAHAAASAQSAQIQQTQAITLATLVKQQEQTTVILQQIRDDQRSGVWLRPKPSNE